MRTDELEGGQQTFVDFFVLLDELVPAVERGAPVAFSEEAEKAKGQILHPAENAVQLGRPEFLQAAHRGGVAPQLLKLVVAHRNAEVLARHVFNLVRLVENHGVVLGEDSAFVVVVLRARSAKKRWWFTMTMSLSAARWCISVMKQRSKFLHFCAGAHLPSRVQLGPHGTRFRQKFDLGAVADFGGLLPLANPLEIREFFQPRQHRLFFGVIDFLPAGVVVPPLHVAHPQRTREMPLQERYVFEEELLLQVLGARGNHDSLAGKQRRHKIGERFSGPRPRLDDEAPLLLERRLYGLRHFQLPRPEFVLGMPLGKRAVA